MTKLGEMIIMKKEQRTVLLVQPPFYRLYKTTYSLARYPLSLGYLAGEIKRNTNWKVIAYNADFHPQNERMKIPHMVGKGFDNYRNNLKDLSGQIWKEIGQTITEYNPTVVGISAKTQDFTSALLVAKLVKKINKQTVVIIGGPHPTVVGADVLNHPEIDICVKGEGENTIIELLDAIEAQKTLHKINGIVYRRDGRIIETSTREFITNLDSLCFPHEYASEVLKDYNHYPITAFENIFAIRGCPYNCTFCGSRNVWSRMVRFRSVENVIREIKGLQKLGLKYIEFNDDTFGINKKYINDLCEALKLHCSKLRWGCELHIKLIDKQNISLMKASGCISISVGIESGNDEILHAIKKNITIKEAIGACKLIKKQGIGVRTFFMVGFPQETEESLMDTFDAMKKVKSDVLIYSIFTPYPGTEAFEFCKEIGLIGDDHDVSLYNHLSPLNHFCINITPERFRVLVSKIEKSVERIKYLNRIKRFFSIRVLITIQEMGISTSIKKGLKILIGK